MVRKAFKQALAEKPGVSFIDFPENIAGADVEGKEPLMVQAAATPEPPGAKVEQAAEIISSAKHPIIMAGNGTIRSRAAGGTSGVRREAPDSRGDHIHGQGSDTVFSPAEPRHRGPTGARLRRLWVRPGRCDHLRGATT